MKISELIEELEKQLTAVTKQRDTLAVALKPFIEGWSNEHCDSVVTVEQFTCAKQALATFNKTQQ
jgi:hypothetical protein